MLVKIEAEPSVPREGFASRMRPRIDFVTMPSSRQRIAPLAGCVTDEPRGGAPMALVNAGRTDDRHRPRLADRRRGHLPDRRSGLPHGIHGIHVHTVGRCDPPDFASAGAALEPGERKHGMNNPAGPHAGDLPNVEVAATAC